MTDLHAAILNLPATPPAFFADKPDSLSAYAEGHRDARHAAAELAAESQAGTTVVYQLTWCDEPLMPGNSLGRYTDLEKAKEQRRKLLIEMGDEDVTIHRVETRVTQVQP